MTPAERVRAAFDHVRRVDFLPPDQRGFAREDRAVPIGHGQTNSQPTTVLNMLDLLEAVPGHHVLDLGCGSGWTTALLGHIVGPTGSVHGLEIVPELAAWGRENLAAYDMAWADIVLANPGRLGLPEQAPFDRILVSAEAGAVPQRLVAQLAVDGVMVIPVAGRMCLVRRTAEGQSVEHHGFYSFVPLVEPDSD